jgi:hypothetical protein
MKATDQRSSVTVRNENGKLYIFADDEQIPTIFQTLKEHEIDYEEEQVEANADDGLHRIRVHSSDPEADQKRIQRYFDPSL